MQDFVVSQNQSIDLAYEELNSNLESILGVYRLLLEVVQREKELLILADSAKILENNATKESCLSKLKHLENERIFFAKRLGILVGLKDEAPRLLDLAGKLTGPRQTKLKAFHETLDLTVRQVYEFNRENEIYAQSALVTLQGALGEIKQTIAPKPTYGRKGKLKDTSERSGHFVSREG